LWILKNLFFSFLFFIPDDKQRSDDIKAQIYLREEDINQINTVHGI
jgi:hypothetical protein